MGLWGKAAKAAVFVVILTQIACRHCMPRTPRKPALNNFNPAKNNPLSTPFPPARTDKTSKQFGKTNQNARISKNKNSFQKESIFRKHNFPENDFPLDTTPRDPFHLKTNFNTNHQANRGKINSLRNAQSSIINELKKERKMKRKLQSNQLNNDINQPTKTLPTTFSSGTENTLLDPNAFPDIQYPLSTMDTWEPMYWNSFSLAQPKPFDGLEVPRHKSPNNENVKNPITRMTKTKARQFLKSYDKLKEENKITSTDNSKRSNAGQSGLNFKKTTTSEKVSDDFITASLLENVPKNSSGTNTTVELSSGEASSPDTQDTCPISDTPVSEGFTKINRSESEIKNNTNGLKTSKTSLLAEALAAIEDLLNSDETTASESAESICEIPKELVNSTCYITENDTTSTRPIANVEASDEVSATFAKSLEVEIDDDICVLQNNISSLLEEINLENSTTVNSVLNVETQIPTTPTPVEVNITDKPNQLPSNQAAPAPTSIIIIPINNNAVGQPQSHMINTTGNAPIIVYIPSTQSSDVPSQTAFCQQNISQASLNKTMPNDKLNNDLSNMAPHLNDNPPSTANVSELLNDISNSESSLPVCEPLPINSMCYNNESSLSSIKEKPFLNDSTHESLTNMTPFVNTTCNEKSLDDELTDICGDVTPEKTLPQMLDSEHPIFDFVGSEVTSLSHGPYNNIIQNELPILTREIDSKQKSGNTPAEHQFVPNDNNATLNELHDKRAELDHRPIDFNPEPDLLSNDLTKTLSEGFMPALSSEVLDTQPDNTSNPDPHKNDAQLSVETTKPEIVDEPKPSLLISEHLAKPIDKTLPTPASEAHATRVPIELSLLSPSTNLFDRRIIIDVKLVPIEDTSDDRHSTKTVQDTSPDITDFTEQSTIDKPLSQNQEPIDLIIVKEPVDVPKSLQNPSVTFVPIDNSQEERYETLPSTPYTVSNTNYNLSSSCEEETQLLLQSKPYLENNLVTTIPNTFASHDNIENNTNDIKDLPLKMGILIPDFSELSEDESISNDAPKNIYVEELITNLNNAMPVQVFDQSSLSHPSKEFDKTSFTAEVLQADDISNFTPKGPLTPNVISVPEDKLTPFKPVQSDTNIDEETRKSVTPVINSVAIKDEIKHMHEKLNDNKSLSPLRTDEVGPSPIDLSSTDVSFDAKDIESLSRLEDNENQVTTSVTDSTQSVASSSVLKDAYNDIPVKAPLPTDISSLTSKLLVTKALLDNVLADIDNTYNTGVLPPSDHFALNNADVAVKISSSEPQLLECPLIQIPLSECNTNYSLNTEEIIPNIATDIKNGSTNALFDIEHITHIDEGNFVDSTVNGSQDLKMPEDMCPLIHTSDFPVSQEHNNNKTINLTKFNDEVEIENASFQKILSDISSEPVVLDRSPLMNKSSDKNVDKLDIVQVDETNSLRLESINKSLSEESKDTSPILDTPTEPTNIQDESQNQSNEPISKSVDEVPVITVTKDLLESVLLDIFTKRLSFPLPQTQTEDTPLISERITHSLETTGIAVENSIPTSTSSEQLEETSSTSAIVNKHSLSYLNNAAENKSDAMSVDQTSNLSKLDVNTSNSYIPKEETLIQGDDDYQTETLKEEIPIASGNSLDIPENQTLSQIFDKQEDIKNYSTSEVHTNESSSTKTQNIISSNSDTPTHDIDSLSQNNPLSTSPAIIITKEVLESVLTDVLRKELLLLAAQSPPELSSSIFIKTPNDKDSSFPTIASENALKENDEATLNASVFDVPTDLSDNVPLSNMSTDQSNLQKVDNIKTVDKIQNKEDSKILLEDCPNELSMPVKELIAASNDETSIELSTTTKPLLMNVLRDIPDEGTSLSVVESAASTPTESPIPDDIPSNRPLKEADESFPNTKFTDCLDSSIDEENIETIDTNKDESIENQTNDANLPTDEIIITIPKDIMSPMSPSELRITKALLQNVLMDIFTKGLLVPVENILHVVSEDDVTNESPIQVQEDVTSFSDHANDNLPFNKETDNHLPKGVEDMTLNITNSNIPTDDSNILTLNNKEEKNDDLPWESGNAEIPSINDTKFNSDKAFYKDDTLLTEKKTYSPIKLTITKALLENLLSDIFTKGLSLPKAKTNSVKSPTGLDKTLYYTETLPDVNNETPLIQIPEVPLDTSLIEHTQNDSTLTENAEKTIPLPADIVDIPSIDNPTEQNTIAIDNNAHNLASEAHNDDLSPLNEGISEPKTAPIASRSALDKTLYFVDTTRPNVKEETTPEHIGETLNILAENPNVSNVENDSIMELFSDEMAKNKNFDPLSEESYGEEIFKNNSEDLSNDAEDIASLENISDYIPLKEDVIEGITDEPAPRSNRILYSKLPSTKALLEKVLFDITNRSF